MSKPTKYYSNRQEQLIARSLGWAVVAGSGARDFHPGDIISDKWIGECKTHTAPGHRITFFATVWNKICEEASSKFKYPALFVDDGSQKLENTWVMFLDNTAYSTEHSKYPIPVSFRTNIAFDGADLLREYRNLSTWCSGIAIWSGTFCGKTVGLLPFYKFQELFEEYNDD